MSTLIAYANIQQPFCFDKLTVVPTHLQLNALPQNANIRVKKRFQARRLAWFLLWQLVKQNKKTFPNYTAFLANISKTASGRPISSYQHIDFNISHSGDWVAVMMSLQTDQIPCVGIDIEVSKQRNFQHLLNHFAPSSEIQWLQQQKNQAEGFYRCWCSREAILKSQGVGIVKLSEVLHLPQQRQLLSQYCPQGTLFFSSELPFYLASFSNENPVNFHLLAWNGKQLQPQSLSDKIYYQVNPVNSIF